MSTDSGGFDLWSWLPFKFTVPPFAMPSFSIPGSIQRRFISFVLRRFIGHLFLPGQLDMKQIESQIGSGSVEITDLQLDPQAVSAHLGHFPLRLNSGSVAKVRVRVPWPNPLTATLGFSISGLKLIFQLPESSTIQSSSHQSEGPVESVATIAEHFLHEELSLQEEAALRDSFHADAKLSTSSIIESAHVPPGSMDPFTSRVEDNSQLESNESDIDPSGISIFASLIEKLLAKFDCDATDVEITLLYPEHASFIFRLSEVSYRTEVPVVESTSNVSVPRRETRSLRLIGVTLSTRDLTPQLQSSPISVQHSDSDVDEAEDMSKSVYLHRSRTPSTSLSASNESIASGMYRSALSTSFHTSAHSPNRNTEVTAHDDEKSTEDMVLSCASEPIVIELITPPSYILRSANVEGVAAINDETLSFHARLGIIACAFGSSHIRHLLDLTNAFLLAFNYYSSSNVQNTNSSSRVGRGSINFTIEGRGFTGLIVSNPLVSFTDLSRQDMDQSMHRFFAKPHIPPLLPCDYIRICINSISLSYSMSSLINGKSNTPFHTMSALHLNSISSTVTLAIMDFSIISFIHSSEERSQLLSFPLLVTDPQLITCYHSSPVHIHPSNDKEKDSLLPTFDIIDWIKNTGRGANNKAWRLKPFHLHSMRHADVAKSSKDDSHATWSQFSETVSTPPEVIETATEPRAICIIIEKNQVVVNVVPFQLSLDLESISHFHGFLNDLTSIFSSNQSTPFPPTVTSDKTEDDDEKGRRLLESLVLADLDLELDYGYARGTSAKSLGILNDHVTKQPTAKLNLSLHVPLIRLQIRAPSPPGYPEARSGYIVLDLHRIEAYYGPDANVGRQVESIRFTNASDPAVTKSAITRQSDQLPLSILFSRIVLAYALPKLSKANAIFSLGPFKQFAEKESPAIASKATLLPSAVFQSRPPKTARTPSASPQLNISTIVFDIPSLFVNLSKVYVDGLQLFADDISQWSERIFGSSRMENVDSKNPSLIGSRFFARYTRSSSSASSTSSEKSKNESIVKFFILDANVRLILSSGETSSSVRFFDIAASDLDVLVELHPDRKDETVVSLSVNTVDISQGQPTAIRSIFFPSKIPLALIGNGPLLQCRFRSFTVPGTVLKQSQLKVTMRSFIFDFEPELDWLSDLARFIQSPPGAFESVVPSERTRIQLNVADGIIRAFAAPERGAIVLHIEDIECSTDLLDSSSDKQLKLSVPALFIFTTDDPKALSRDINYRNSTSKRGKDFWRFNGCCLVAELLNLKMRMEQLNNGMFGDNRVHIDSLTLAVHICADSISGIASFANEFLSALQGSTNNHSTPPEVTSKPLISTATEEQINNNILQSLDESAFRRIPDVGAAPDMIDDDLPTNPVYLDTSFGTPDETAEEYAERAVDVLSNESPGNISTSDKDITTGIISNFNGETIKMFVQPLTIIEHFYDTITPEEPKYGETSVRVRAEHCDLRLFLYEGYDWAQTRKIIEEETKKIRKRLAKIRQLLANGQNYEPVAEETGILLFNSVYVGLETEDFEPVDLINAIDDELREDQDSTSESSWQSFKPQHSNRTPMKSKNVREGRLNRSRESSIEISFLSLNLEFDRYQPDESLISRLLFTIEDLEILDHIKTSTWSKFLTELQSDIHGNIRETGSNMVKVELRSLHPAGKFSGQEARLKAKLLPLRLYVDQDALDFLKKFFSFKQAETRTPSTSNDEIFFQHVEIFPIGIKLDYKPRRVDYRALREGRTIELMNFFHFDGAEMTLRHITLRGISGWARVFDTLNDLWTPDVKANQLMDVISGVSPIRSAVNVGSGVADLVLLPIAQYKKDGRIIRGMQKGATSFVRSTGVEAIKIGAQLATGTQVILEGAENVLGGAFTSSIITEAIQIETSEEETLQGMYSESNELISKYADQPMNIKEGVQSAYKTLSKNIKSAGQTILAVPMEIYESSTDEGPARAIVRAVPIAVLKPMIGASEAVSKTLLGLRNSLDPHARHEHEAKYKRH